MPSSEGSITQWISRLKKGNPAAAEQLWVRFHERLIQLAVARMQELPKRMADENDVVAAALAGCLQAIQDGRYPRLASREDFWLLLVRSTEH